MFRKTMFTNIETHVGKEALFASRSPSFPSDIACPFAERHTSNKRSYAALELSLLSPPTLVSAVDLNLIRFGY